METSTQFQTNATSKPNLDSSANIVRKAQALVSTAISSNTTTNSISASSTAQSNVAGIAGGGANEIQSIAQKINSITNSTVPNSNSSSNTSVANLIATSTNATVVSNGQATPAQQIIQVSSQGGAIMSGQQLMVQTLSGRPAIQLRTGQQFQQIQLIPFGNLQGQNQRPVIIQQTPGNVQLHSSATTIASMANLAHNNVAKITAVSTGNTTAAHQKPVIIQQQSATGQFIHSTNAQSHNLHGHNVTKIATVGRTQARPTAQGKMVLGHLTTATQNHQTSAAAVVATSGSPVTSNHHTGVLTANQQNHLTNNSAGNANSNAQQVTRLNIISSLPSGVHTSVSNVHHATGKPILSLATATLNKPLIINPASNVVQPSIVGNVVNMSNFNATSHQLKQPNTGTNIIPTVMTLTTLTTSSGTIPGRHTMITSNSTQQFNQASSVSSSPLTNSNSGQLIINSSNINPNQPASLAQQQQLASAANVNNSSQQQASQLNQTQPQLNLNAPQSQLSSSAIRSSATLNSPIKQQLPQNTPSSPRPSILIRKRVGTPLDMDSKLNYQSSSSSINSNSANTKNSQLNSVKQNLSLKYQNSSSSSTTNSSAALSMKNAQELLNNTSSTVNKLQSNANVLNTIKKPNPDSITVTSQAQSIKSETELMTSKQMESTNQLVNNTSNHANNNNLSNNSTDNRQITPRKRRKQLLEPFMLTNSQNIKLLNDDSNSTNLLCNEELRKKDNGQFSSSSMNYQTTSNSICRRPRPSLMSSYNITWKSLQYHFLRHAEVKIKNEKKVNLQDLTNETLKKRNGWKVGHLSTQLEDILECEISFNRKLKELSKLYGENKNLLPAKVKELGSQPFNAKVCHNSISVLDKLNDLFAANIQRSNLIHDQIKDTNNILNKLTNDHKEKVNRMSKKFLNNKRSTTVKV